MSASNRHTPRPGIKFKNKQARWNFKTIRLGGCAAESLLKAAVMALENTDDAMPITTVLWHIQQHVKGALEAA
jgi:hypothetical protein